MTPAHAQDREAFDFYLHARARRGQLAGAAAHGTAGAAECGDMASIRVDVHARTGVIAAAGWDAAGCGATHAACAAAGELVDGLHVLDAARISAGAIAAECGGLSASKQHAAELAADALHGALGRSLAFLALPESPGRILAACSGGVDSSLAAALLAEAGREVVAVTVELWRDQHSDAQKSCCSSFAVRLARREAHRQGMAHFTLELRDAFRAGVVGPYVDAHRGGLTPTPCVACNGSVRLPAMLDASRALGAGQLATGHYARVQDDGQGPLLAAAADPAKDQSAMLAALPPDLIGRLVLPLGEITKARTRELAAERGLAAAKRPDSQDLCFLAGTSRPEFLARHGGLEARPGDILDEQGAVLGRHGGAHLFTAGQRRGLGLPGGGPALHVLRVDAAANTVTVGPRERLQSRAVKLRAARLWRPGSQVDGIRLRAKSPVAAGRLAGDLPAGLHSRAEARLAEPGEAAPGQSAALMSGSLVVGHAVIGR